MRIFRSDFEAFEPHNIYKGQTEDYYDEVDQAICKFNILTKL